MHPTIAAGNNSNLELVQGVTLIQKEDQVDALVNPFVDADAIKIYKKGFMARLKNMDGTGVYWVLTCESSAK